MKKSGGFLVLLLLIPTIVPVYAAPTGSRARVAILPVIDTSPDQRFAAAGDAVRETAGLLIRLSGGYDVAPLSTVQEAELVLALREGPAALKALCERHGLDLLIVSRVRADPNAYCVVELSVFELAQGRFTTTQSRPVPSLFHVFEAADALVVSFLESWSGRLLRFGSLRIRPTAAGRFLVDIDGLRLDPIDGVLERVVAGPHRLKVVQKRLGGEEVVHEALVAVPDNQTVEVAFDPPRLTERERKLLDELRGPIEPALWRRDQAARVDAGFAAYFAATSDQDLPPSVQEERRNEEARHSLWRATRLSYRIEDLQLTPDRLISAGPRYAGENAAIKGTHPDLEGVKRANDEALSALYLLGAARLLGDADLQGAVRRYGELDSFDDAMPADIQTRHREEADLVREVIEWKRRANPSDADSTRLVHLAFSPRISRSYLAFGPDIRLRTIGELVELAAIDRQRFAAIRREAPNNFDAVLQGPWRFMAHLGVGGTMLTDSDGTISDLSGPTPDLGLFVSYGGTHYWGLATYLLFGVAGAPPVFPLPTYIYAPKGGDFAHQFSFLAFPAGREWILGLRYGFAMLRVFAAVCFGAPIRGWVPLYLGGSAFMLSAGVLLGP